MRRLSFFTVIPILLAPLTACDRYRVTVNEHAVYEPAPLFSDYAIEDRALFYCIQQTIEDQRITAAAQLKELNCSHAGIASLQGLERFDQLQALNVRNNAIIDIGTLQQLPRLQQLDLADNRLRTVNVLMTLPNMESVNLQNNANLDCQEGIAVARVIKKTLLPEHCTKAGAAN